MDNVEMRGGLASVEYVGGKGRREVVNSAVECISHRQSPRNRRGTAELSYSPPLLPINPQLNVITDILFHVNIIL